MIRIRSLMVGWPLRRGGRLSRGLHSSRITDSCGLLVFRAARFALPCLLFWRLVHGSHVLAKLIDHVPYGRGVVSVWRIFQVFIQRFSRAWRDHIFTAFRLTLSKQD